MPTVAQESVEVTGSSEVGGVTSSNSRARSRREVSKPDAWDAARDWQRWTLRPKGVMPSPCGEDTFPAGGELAVEPTSEWLKKAGYSPLPPPRSPASSPSSSSSAGLFPACRTGV